MTDKKDKNKDLEIVNEVEEFEEEVDLVTLLDEEGNEVEFLFLDSIEMEEDEFVVLLPFDEENSESDEGEVIILKYENTEDGEEVYSGIEDEDLLQKVFDEFRSRNCDEYEFEN